MLKLIAVELSDKCIMKPNCPFCYLEKSGDEMRYLSGHILGIIKKYAGNVAKVVTVCFEYNGYNLDYLKSIWIPRDTGLEFTMTTMPAVVTDVFAGFISHHNIKAVALSYDEYKLRGFDPIKQWARKAQILKDHGIKVSCNYLLTDVTMNELFRSFNNEEPSDLAPILDTADQINFLSLKPTGKYSDTVTKAIHASIESLKLTMPVAVDNCLGVQLGYTSRCHAGDEFVHIMADGTVKPCCFGDKCFLYGKIGETSEQEVIQC